MRFILGIVTGIVAGMLIAPDKGKKTREKINSEFPKYKRQANESLQDAIERTKTMYNDLVNELGLTTEKLEQEKKRKAGNKTNGTTNANTANTGTNSNGNNSENPGSSS